jgi:succinyl-diaminopimelate desuccinylase
MRNDGAVSARIDLSAELAELTLQLVNVSSVSRDEGALADEVEASLQGLPHLQVNRVGNNVVAKCVANGGRRVLLGGHLDTVPASENFPGERRADTVWGLGSCDMKGGVAVALKLAAEVARPDGDVTYVFYECEEVESVANGLGRLQRESPESLQTDLAILLEPTNAQVEAGCQGVARVKVHVDGKRAHVARWWVGDNAIHGLAPIVAAVGGVGERRPVIDGLEYREGLQVVGVSGGAASNVVPDHAWIEISYRFAPDRSDDEAVTVVRELVAQAVGVVSDDAASGPGSGARVAVSDAELAEAGLRIEVVDVEGAAPPNLSSGLVPEFLAHSGASVSAKLGWTDVARFAGLGVPAVNFGPGDPLVAHTHDEHVPISQLQSCYATLYSYLTA